MLRFNVIIPVQLFAILLLLGVVLWAFGIEGIVVFVLAMLLLTAFGT